MISKVELLSATALIAVSLAGCAPKESAPAAVAPGHAELTEVWRIESGFEKPESAVFDLARNVIYVSNIGNDFAAKDGSGYISRVAPDGSQLDSAWVSGLNAPKGLALRGNLLYASVVDELVAIDVNTGEVVGQYPAADAQFLNDVTIDEAGRVYVSDSGTGRVYRLSGDNLTSYLTGGSFSRPNGVYATNEGLVVATADSAADDPMATRFLRLVNYETGSVETLGDLAPLTSIDAVEPDGHGGFLISDWTGGSVYRWSPAEGVVVLEEIERGTADFTYVPESGMIYLPLMMTGQLVAYSLEWH